MGIVFLSGYDIEPHQGPISDRTQPFVGKLGLIVGKQCDDIDAEHGADLIQVGKAAACGQVGRGDQFDRFYKVTLFKAVLKWSLLVFYLHQKQSLGRSGGAGLRAVDRKQNPLESLR